MNPIQTTVWGEYVAEKEDSLARATYPKGMHEEIATALCEHLEERVLVRTATLEKPEHGLTEDVLDATDVLIWWGHRAHERVSDDVAARVRARVLDGMGLVARLQLARHGLTHARHSRSPIGPVYA
jgi:trehalose utilization protein